MDRAKLPAGGAGGCMRKSSAGLAVAALLLAAGPVAAQAVQPTDVANAEREARVRLLKQRVLQEGGTIAQNAAFDLFMTGRPGLGDLGPEGAHDDFLRGVFRGDTPAGARQAVLEALRSCGRFRLQVAFDLVRDGLADSTPIGQSAISQLALTVLPALDDITEDRDPNRPVAPASDIYVLLRQRLVELRRARPGGALGREALALVDGLERMPNPVRSVAMLIEVLNTQLARGIEERIREALQRMTVKAFDTPKEWSEWYELEPSKRSLAEWRLAIYNRRDERVKRLERDTTDYFLRFIGALKPEDRLNELKKAADKESTVRRAAIRELGLLAKQGNQDAGKWLRERLKQGAMVAHDETKALCIEALGESGLTAAAEDVIPFLNTPEQSTRMRAAAAQALGKLQAVSSIDTLLEVMAQADLSEDLRRAIIEALGRIGQNPGGRVSRRLVGFAEGLLGAVNGAAAPAAELLSVTAGALGTLGYRDAPAADVDKAVDLVIGLAAHQDADVRLFAVSALGTMPPAKPFPALRARLGAEGAVHVRRAIVDALGQHAVDNWTHEGEYLKAAVDLLVPLLTTNADEIMRTRAQRRLEEIATKPTNFLVNFTGLKLVVTKILENGKPDLAVPFLKGDRLPPADQVEAAHRPIYFQLLGVRAEGQLEADPAAALVDYEAVIQGLSLQQPGSVTARALHLGRARAMLRLTPPKAREALPQLLAILQSLALAGETAPEGPWGAVWAAVVDGAEKLAAVDKAAVGPALVPFAEHRGKAPLTVQARLNELEGRGPGPGGGK